MFGLIFLARMEKRLLVRYIDSGILPTIFWIALRCYVCSRVAVCLWHCIFGSNIGKRNISVAAEIAYFPRSKSPYARHEMWRYSAMASCVRDSRRRSARSSFEISFASKTVYNPLGYLILYQGGTDRGEARWNEREAEEIWAMGDILYGSGNIISQMKPWL